MRVTRTRCAVASHAWPGVARLGLARPDLARQPGTTDGWMRMAHAVHFTSAGSSAGSRDSLSSSPIILQTHGLTKLYGTKRAVSDLSLSVRHGEVY